MYTRKELQRYKVKELKLLAEYDEIEIPKKSKKIDIIDILLQELDHEVVEVQEVEETPCSVRIKRIRDSKEN